MRVYVDMVADLFHIGHLNLIRRAKEIGDFLIVGIHSDKSVESYKRSPIINEDQRYEIVRSCQFVDKVIEDAPLVISSEYIKEHNIECVVHGDDITEEMKRQHKVAIEMGIVKYLPRTSGISTSEIIEKIVNRGSKSDV